MVTAMEDYLDNNTIDSDVFRMPAIDGELKMLYNPAKDALIGRSLLAKSNFILSAGKIFHCKVHNDNELIVENSNVFHRTTTSVILNQHNKQHK